MNETFPAMRPVMNSPVISAECRMIKSKRAEQATVDEYLSAVDVARGIAGQKHAQARHVFGNADPFHRIYRRRCGLSLRSPCLRDVGIESAWHDKVGADLRCPCSG